MNENRLRKNQLEAIQISKENDFQSGIHYHATGTGKSWIAMYILMEYNLKYPNSNVLWICERKDILIQQFSKEILKERGFTEVLKKFNVLDFVINKNSEWYNSLNSSGFWGKPFLCIINRTFLTTKEKYKLIKSKIGLVIHDECHSIENKTTQDFYNWLSPKTRIIGFSATPEYMEPLTNVISKYSIYDGYLDKVILPPKIIWLKSEKKPTFPHLITFMKKQIEKLPYKKIIVWSGIIEECIKLAETWEEYFQDYNICLDFNNIEKKYNKFNDFESFYYSKEKSILFCAVKHREGSDIPYVDGCIFMDMVSQRSERVFIQCMGRVLRKDKENKKKYGMVIDLRAKSTIEICNRVQHYLKLEDTFPWEYSIKKMVLDKRTYFVNELNMVEGKIEKAKIEPERIFTREEIISNFKREIPDKKKYTDRLNYELDLIISKNLFGNIVQAIEILKLTKNIPHVTRGSCGSSLVCYLLGISHVDPMKYKISFARFLNKYKDKLPDVDFDFPHYLRDEVFLKLFQKWGGNVARISNHNYYHEKSALREALRMNGIRKFISKYDLNEEIKSYDKTLQNKIFKTQRELEGTFRGFSLHCGGIIYFPNGIEEENLLDNKNTVLKQVKFNRDEVSDNKNFKIDILSSRALSQLYYCHSFKNIDFSKHIGDPKTIELLSSGKNIGITLAETPLMRKALLLIKPKSIMELAICLSIIRPAAKEARKEFEAGEYNNDSMVFDDDVISIIAKLVGCEEDMADKLRREYCKKKPSTIRILEKYLIRKSIGERRKIKAILRNLTKYGFCKAHALSYAQLVWQLAYQKAHRPKKFWKSTLKNVDTCYRKWVHLYEAKCEGIDSNQRQKSIYAVRRNKNCDEISEPIEQLKKYGYWNMKDDTFFDNCYFIKNSGFYNFRGLIASSRTIKNKNKRNLVLFVGVEKGKFIEVIIKGNYKFTSQNVIVKGRGVMTNKLYTTIECSNKNVEFI